MVQVAAHLVGEIVRRIVETIHPKKILLFGSRARGDARPESDIDLLVIADSTEPRYRRSAPL
jgi:predicted nucleotidyltransferase